MSPYTRLTLAFCFLLQGNYSIQAQQEIKVIPESLKTITLTDKTPEWFLTIKYNVHLPQTKKPLSILKDSIYPQPSALQPTSVSPAIWSARLMPQLTAEYDGGDSYATPNDDYLALSAGGKIVAVQNNLISVLEENGTVLVRKSLRAFSGDGTNDRPFDPRVVYDEAADRFILVFLTGTTFETNKIHIAFSANNNPAADWFHYTFSGNAYGDSSWNDFPAMAISGNYLYLTFNTFGNGSVNNSRFHQSVIWRVDKQKGYANAPPVELSTSIFQGLKHNGAAMFNITPVSESPDTAAYFLSNHALTASSNHNFFLLKLSSTDSSPQIRVLESNIPYQLPPDATQKDVARKLNTNDARVQDAVFNNNSIAFVLNSARMINGNPQPASYFGQIRDIRLNSLSGEFLPDTLETAFPSLIPANGGFLFCYSHSSPAIFPGVTVIYRDNAGNYSLPLRVKAGSKNVSFWGDYNKICSQPSKQNSYWLAGAYGLDVGTVSDGELATTIAGIELAESTGVNKPSKNINQTKLYPNPVVHNRLTLEINLPQAQKIGLFLYDMQGKFMEKIFESEMPGGEHHISFSTGDLKSGTYFIKIETENNTLITKKVIVK
jgi:hypothetical protein